jgi:hypothetical protein
MAGSLGSVLWSRDSLSGQFLMEKWAWAIDNLTPNLEPPVRIELTTFRLQGGCSTTELGRPYLPAHYVSDEEIAEILSAEQL